MNPKMVKRALISVSDKTGAVEFAKELESLGFEIISTGGTAKTLADAGVKITVIQSVTEFPECLDGRLKTLHPKIHGGLLAMRGNQKHMAEMRELGVGMIDLLAVNLYPFLRTIAKEGVTLEEAIEQIDIGGPAMLRSAAKNCQDVTVLVDPADYGTVLGEIERAGSVSRELKFSLARKVFEHTASYDAMIAEYLGRRDGGGGAAFAASGGDLGQAAASAPESAAAPAPAQASALAQTSVAASAQASAPATASAYSPAQAPAPTTAQASASTTAPAYSSAPAPAPATTTAQMPAQAQASASATASAHSPAPAPSPAEPAFRDKYTVTFDKAMDMRYGENPHQRAAFYREPLPAPGSLATFWQLHGKELSYNNIGDLDGALSLLEEFGEPAAVAVKHANPCGAAVAADIHSAFAKAWESDPTSIYGGIIALNRAVDAATAAEIDKIFIEIVAAPDFDADALAILTKKKNIRLLKLDTAAARKRYLGGAGQRVMKKVSGGLLVQEIDAAVADRGALKTVTARQPSEAELDDMMFGMAVVKHTKSNAIALAKDMATVGVGPGQTSRIMATKIAIEIAGGRAGGAVAASDAFFPFGDCAEAMAAAGVTAIIQPGGSKNDKESVEACDRHGMAMVLTGMRHFMH
jgi:AICAR transformylase/IMP cyclohydrolase PurH